MEQHEGTVPSATGGERCAADVPLLRERTSALLRARVPLTLLLDLVDPAGPDSAGRYGPEGGDASWLHAV